MHISATYVHFEEMHPDLKDHTFFIKYSPIFRFVSKINKL